MSAASHMERVAGLRCVICWFKLGQKTYNVQVHHVGDASDRSDWATVPICFEHHLGSTGVHGLHRRGFERMWKTNDIEMLAWTNELLAKASA
jgi:hypothetical protein